MATTKLANVYNPEVLADMISAKLPTANTLLQIFKQDDTLVAQPGDTITVPKWAYVGDAEEVAEGEEATSVALSHTTQKATVKKAVKDVELTDEVKLSGYGDPVGEVQKQLTGAIAGKMATDIIAALAKTSLAVTGEKVNLDVLVQDATDKLVVDMEQEGQDFDRYLLASRKVVSQLRRLKLIQSTNIAGERAIINGVVGEFDGALVVPIDKMTDNVCYVVKGDAVTLYHKRKVSVEADRIVKGKKDLYSADAHYVAALSNEGSAVKITVSDLA